MTRKNRTVNYPDDKLLALAIAPWLIETKYSEEFDEFEYNRWELRFLPKQMPAKSLGIVLHERDLMELENPGAAALDMIVKAARNALQPRDGFCSAKALAAGVGEAYADRKIGLTFTPKKDVYHWISKARELLETLPAVHAMAAVAEVTPYDMAHTLLFSKRATGYRIIFPPEDITMLTGPIINRSDSAILIAGRAVEPSGVW